MKRNHIVMWINVGLILAVLVTTPAVAAKALQFSCSNQVFKAFSVEGVAAFTKATGVEVEVHPSSSNSALYRLMNGYSEIAATAWPLYRRHEDHGFRQIAFCRDPLAVIARIGCGVKNISQKQLQDVFSGTIKNWKELGGADLPIVVIVPGEHTAANKNFRRQVMKKSEIRYEIMVHESTMAIETVKHFPCGAVSFISQGAIKHQSGIRALTIDGLDPEADNYPFIQNFYYVTKGKQSGAVKRLIDFTFSAEGARIIRKNGMIPIGLKP